MSKKRIFSKEYKIEAVSLIRSNGNIRQTALSLGIYESVLRRWIREYELNPSVAFTVRCNAEVKSADQQELQALRRENKALKMEREILKKAMSIFAKNDR